MVESDPAQKQWFQLTETMHSRAGMSRHLFFDDFLDSLLLLRI